MPDLNPTNIGGGGFGFVAFTPETHDGFENLYNSIVAEQVTEPDAPNENTDEPDTSNDTP